MVFGDTFVILALVTAVSPLSPVIYYFFRCPFLTGKLAGKSFHMANNSI